MSGEVAEWLVEPNEIVWQLADKTMRRRKSGVKRSDRRMLGKELV